MKVGDLVCMPGSIVMETGIILRAPHDSRDGPPPNVEVWWITDAVSTWEPRKWLKVINSS
tara:strand:- start:804 stop:983 length:180 start_codon:yes stop_codon:yes gene_type:complete